MIVSPCISICKTDPVTGYCYGCARSSDEKIAAIVKNLIGRGQSRPRKEKTLRNTINALFTEKLQDQELNELIDGLKRKRYITINDGNISYTLPRKN